MLLVEPHSLIECIANCGMPTSTVVSPSLADMIGPMVDPHKQSFLTMKSWTSTPTNRLDSLRTDAEIEFVAYR